MEAARPLGRSNTPLSIPNWSPDAIGNTTRTPSRSPRRSARKPSVDIESLYKDKSPSRLLRDIVANADSSIGIAVDNGRLIKSIESATTLERGFGRKVAETSRLLREWCTEIEGWPWEGTFERPQKRIEDGRDDAADGFPIHEFGTREESELKHTLHDDYWGSLPPSKVIEFEERLDDIRDGIDDLDVEGQKEHVLSTHTQNKSSTLTQDFSEASMSSQHIHLDGLTALVTMTVVRALPYYLKLTALIAIWAARIAVLKQIPAFQEKRRITETSLNAAWTGLGMPQDRLARNEGSQMTEAAYQNIPRDSFEKVREELARNIADLGRNLDIMLDSLEGLEESLPDCWIDAVEALEVDYSVWTVEAQRAVLRLEYKIDEVQDTIDEHVPADPNLAFGSHIQDSHPQMETNMKQSSEEQLSFARPALSASDLSKRLDDEEEKFYLHEKRLTSPLDVLSRIEKHETSLSIEPHNQSSTLSDSGSKKTTEIDDGLATSQNLDPVKESNSNAHGKLPQLDKHFDSSHQKAAITTSATDIISFDALRDSPVPGASSATLNENAYIAFDDSPKIQNGDEIYTSTDADLKSADGEPPRSRTHNSSHHEIERDDQLERQINNIISTVPARIHLAKDAFLPNVKSSVTAVSNDVSFGATAPEIEASETIGADITLSPAYQRESKSSRSTGSSEIKLYHMITAGREKPIKLFVRLVGERGERVMVRVGGGWADLGDYLREYALHHGRHTVTAPTSGPLSQRSDRSSTVQSMTNSTVDSNREHSLAVHLRDVPHMFDTTKENSSSILLSDIDNGDRQSSSRRISGQHAAQHEAHTADATQPGHSISGYPGGSKISDLSLEKRRWVEDMLEQTRAYQRGSPSPIQGQRAESPRFGMKGDFEELGKVGNTRRIYRVSDGVGKPSRIPD